MKRKIAVTGLGVISPVGNDINSFWSALLRGESGAGPVTHFDASQLESRVAAEVKDFNPGLWMDKKESRKMALFSQYAVAAAVQAWRDAGFDDAGEKLASSGHDRERTAICLGNGIGGLEVFQESYAKLLESGPDRMPPMTVPLMIANEAAANVAMRLTIQGPAFTQVTACSSGNRCHRPSYRSPAIGSCRSGYRGWHRSRYHGVRHGWILPPESAYNLP